MKPMGRKPSRFPRKIDCHPPRGYENWWESEGCSANKKAERQFAKKLLQEMTPMPFDFVKVVDEHFWELLA